MFRFFGFLFALGTLVFIVSVGAISGLLYHFSKDLPDYSQLQDYEPPVMTRVHAADGELLAEYAKQRRLYLPIQAVPKLVINAFISAEDKNFYDHPGIDFSGIARAGVLYLKNIGKNRRPQGASTITQQVAKNFLLTNEVSFDRKIKEALLALKIERTYSKEKILELYLNEIYLGFSAYGVAAASLLYFDKSVNELTIAEASYLAALPKAPTDLHPFRNRERAIERRNYVIERLVENGYITADAGDKAMKEPLAVTQRATGAHIFAADYFAEDVRREILEKFGEKRLYEGGLSVRTTLDPKMQVVAHKALSDGLVRFDEGRGFRGPVSKIDIGGDWGLNLADVRAFADIAWRLAVVLETSDQSARIGLQPAREPGGAVVRDRQIGIIPIEGAKWARPSSAKQPLRLGQVVSPGDVVYVDPLGPGKEGQYKLRQIPEVSGGMVVMDPLTGRVLALVGGFSFDQSQFDRATQAMRQPGSAFKPFVYSAAIDNGYTPSTIVMDAPIEIDQGPGIGIWRPENYANGRPSGPADAARRHRAFPQRHDGAARPGHRHAADRGICQALRRSMTACRIISSYALGAGETTVMRMVTAYSMFANGGRRVNATLIDRIQDRYGRTIYKHDQRECTACDATRWENQPEPGLIDRREQVLDPMTAYQITSIMEGVGTAAAGRVGGQRSRQAGGGQDGHHQ